MAKIFKYFSAILGAIVILIPIYIVFAAAFKSKEEFATTLPYAFPNNLLNFDNFGMVFAKGNFGLAFLNIGYIIALPLLGNILIGTSAAYVLGRFEFKLKKVIMAAYALSIIIPGITTQVATFTIMKHLGLTNTIYSMVVLNLGTDVIQIYVYLQLIKNIPYALDESAMIEGASLFKIYRSIIFPLLKPAIVTLIILKTIGLYNDMYTPYLYMPSNKLVVVSTAMMKFSDSITTDWNALSAAVLVVIIPTITIYVFLQKYIFAGITGGSVKG